MMRRYNQSRTSATQQPPPFRQPQAAEQPPLPSRQEQPPLPSRQPQAQQEQPTINHYCHRAELDLNISDSITNSDVLRSGLNFVGFDDSRQNVRKELNLQRFISFYGVGAATVKDVLIDLKKHYPDTSFKDAMMTFNWLKLYDTEHVLSGRWKRGEEYIRQNTKKISKCIQSLKSKKVVFDKDMFHKDEVHWLSVDTVNYVVEELRQTPGTKWWNHKSNSAGFKYEYGLAIRHPTCVWARGPFPAAEKHDKTVFCGGTNKQPREQWDRNSLYHHIPKRKKALGDSAYEGVPEKVTVKRAGQDKEVQDLID
ncbi:hypothetical protein ACHAXM_001847, partial [Skeletonema potamos]